MSCCCPNKILTYRITQFWASILNMVLCCPPPNNLPIARKRTAESPYLAFPLSLSLQAAAQFQLISAKSSGFWVISASPSKVSELRWVPHRARVTSSPLHLKGQRWGISGLWAPGAEGPYPPGPCCLGNKARTTRASSCYQRCCSCGSRELPMQTTVINNFCEIDKGTVISRLVLSGSHRKLN